MEVKINKEIRHYKESIFFGLSFRQFLCSLLACAMAVLLYFYFDDYLNKEVLSWICILGAIPFAGLGFFKYNGMPLEQFIRAYMKSKILVPRNLKFVSENIYYQSMESYFENQKEELNDKINSKHKKSRKK